LWFETIQARKVPKTLSQPIKSWAWWCMPVIPATQKVQLGECQFKHFLIKNEKRLEPLYIVDGKAKWCS
jgi:hypothetical protein